MGGARSVASAAIREREVDRARAVCARRHDSDETVIGSARELEIARREPRRASEKIDVQGYEKM